MTKEEIIQEAESLSWRQSIKLFDDYTTKGLFAHCDEETATNRFGLPLILNTKKVVDIGGNNGYHSFLAEKRGASEVVVVEPNQGEGDNLHCLYLAKYALKSDISIYATTLHRFVQDNAVKEYFDLALMYGVLYHVTEPIDLLASLYRIIKPYGHAIIETAISEEIDAKPTWQFKNGHDGDDTNFWYPSLTGLKSVLKFVGFKHTEILYNDTIRATIKCYK